MDDEPGSSDSPEFDDEPGMCGKAQNSLMMMCFGIVLFPLALFLLGWNENNYVCENSRILYADARAKPVGCSNRDVINQFAFFSCPFIDSTLETFTPCSFNRQNAESCVGQPPISFTSASGKQTVEMLQCQESCKTKNRKDSLGNNRRRKVCTYELAWSGHAINSAGFNKPPEDVAKTCPNFDHAGGNPVPPINLDMGPSDQYAQDVHVGESKDTSFAINRELVTQLYPSSPVDLRPFTGMLTTGAATAAANTQPWVRPLKVTANNVMVSGTQYLTTCAHLALGCVRISYARSNSSSPSVITRVATAGQTKEEQIAGSWGCSAKGWQAILPERMDKDMMIQELQSLNKIQVWIIRIVGLIAAWLAIYACFQPIAAAADIIGDCVNYLPCGGYLEDFLEGIVTSILCIMSCGIGCSTGLFVIALVWLFMRPLIGGVLLGVCVLLCCCAVYARSMTTKRPIRRKGDGYGYAPLDRNMAEGFIDALRAEYLQGQEHGVENFYQYRDIQPNLQQKLEPYEGQVRDAYDKRGSIKRLAQKWGLEDTDSEGV